MTIQVRAKQIWPGLSNQELDIVLWSCTTFPSGNEDDILAVLKDAYLKSGGDLLQALHQADQTQTAKR